MKPGPLQEKWLQALESGDYEQGTGQLHQPKLNQYCCLGVACAELKKDLNITAKVSMNDAMIYDGETAFMSKRVTAELGLHSEKGVILPEHRVAFHKALRAAGALMSKSVYLTLADYNDDLAADFKQIAAAIREVPEAVFCKSV